MWSVVPGPMSGVCMAAGTPTEDTVCPSSSTYHVSENVVHSQHPLDLDTLARWLQPLWVT